jgi:pectate lyase
LSGVGIRILDVSNVIVRNLKISNVLAEAGDAIGIQQASQIWIDHVDLSSNRDHDKDYYDGLLDITHGSFGVTVTWSKLHDHWKGSLVGHSDSNGAEDVNLRVTYAYNWWSNMNSRTPSFRFGQGHILANCKIENSLYDLVTAPDCNTCIFCFQTSRITATESTYVMGLNSLSSTTYGLGRPNPSTLPTGAA